LLIVESLEAETLICTRGGRTVFRGVRFRAATGELLSVEGANGAGKTSLLRLIAGFLAPAAGTIRLRTNNADIEDAEERGKFVGFLGHQDAVKAQMTAAEALTFFADLYCAKGSVADALAEVGLARLADLPGHYLSAGQKKRLSLARLKLCARPLWLLDEPFAGLDAAGKTFAAGLIAAHCARGGIAIAATHEPLGLPGTTLTLGAP
jgi:heme exporter protein A